MTEKPNEQAELPMITFDIRGGWTSASSALADSLCQGRHLAQRGLPDLPKDDNYAEHGQAIHAALAARDPAALTEAAHNTYDRCLEIEERAVKQFFGDEAEDLMTVAEERFWVMIGDGEKKLKHSAQVDRVYRSKTKALVIDYKTLPGDHDAASENAQLRDEVCLVNGNLLVHPVGAIIIQPLVTMSPEICVFTKEQIKKSAEEMFDRVRASNNPRAELTAGDKQCAYCKFKFKCSAFAKYSASQVPVMQSFVDSPVNTWTNEQCGIFLERYASAAKWLEDVKYHIRLKVEKGELPGWKIGQGDRMFKVTDMNLLFDRAMGLGISEQEFMDMCTVHKESLAKLVRKLTKTKGKGLESELDKLFLGICAEERKRGSIERVQETKTVETK